MQVMLVCWKCLAKGDGIKQFQSVACTADSCKQHNHSLLNETKKVIVSQSIVEKVAQNNNIQSKANQSKRYLQVLPVILSHDSYLLRTNALLGCGADSTLFREDITEILQLKREQKSLTKDTESIFRFRSDRIKISKFYNFVKPSAAENTNHQSMVNTKLADPTH